MKRSPAVNPLVWVAAVIVLAIVLLPTGSNPDGAIPRPFGLIGGLLVLALVGVGIAASSRRNSG